LAQARALVAPFELLRPLPAVCRFAFGNFFDDRCSGAVVYGAEYGANLSYFAFRGSRREQRELRAAIGHLIKPYPKRPNAELRQEAKAEINHHVTA
jgi:hypothetical protein